MFNRSHKVDKNQADKVVPWFCVSIVLLMTVPNVGKHLLKHGRNFSEGSLVMGI
jgi:uncharacterized membrane protein YadS